MQAWFLTCLHGPGCGRKNVLHGVPLYIIYTTTHRTVWSHGKRDTLDLLPSLTCCTLCLYTH